MMHSRKHSLKDRFWDLIKSPFAFNKTGYHAPDYIFAGSLGLIVVVGLLMLSSASSVQSFKDFGDVYYLFKHQFISGIIPGVIAFYIASRIDYQVWKKYALWMLLATVVLLVAVFIPGIGANYDKSQSWINLGFFGFQPTEIVKLTFLIYLATWLEKRGKQGLRDSQTSFLPFMSLLGVLAFLILAQPDTGTLAVIITISLVVYFIAEAPLKHLTIIVGLFAFMVFIAIQIAPYRLARITAFLHPDIDPQGIGYQVNQAKLAVGSGGFFGLGIGKSRQKFSYLPEVSGDSIFAVIAEEMGFFFSILLIGLFITLGIRGLKIARASPDVFGKLLATGITTWLIFQALINIGAIIGIMPLTGIPLPFVSYGGTATVVGLFACGILLNISKQTRNA